jgi:hypothetical protein
MSDHNATERQVTLFLEDAMSYHAMLIRDHELCPECATAAFIRVLIKSIEIGLIKQIEDYTDAEKARLPYFSESADDFFYNQREVDDIGDCVGTA